MLVFLSLLFVALLLVLIVGLIKPEAMENKKKGTPTPTRKQILKYFGIPLLGVFILILIFTPEDNSKGDKGKEDKITEKEIFYVVESLDELKKRFNSFAAEANSPLRITSMSIDNGQIYDVSKYIFNKNIGLVCQIDKKTKAVRSITMLGSGDGSMRSGLNIIMAMGGVITIAKPDLSPDDRGKILREIGFIGDNVDMNNLKGKARRGDIEYAISSSPETGIFFTAEHVKNL